MQLLELNLLNEIFLIEICEMKSWKRNLLKKMLQMKSFK